MTPDRDSHGLTNLVYDALLGDGSWNRFLDEARRLLPNGQGFLFYHDAAAGTGAFSISAGTDDGLVAAYNEYYSALNPWMPHAAIRPLGKVVQADAMLARADLVGTEFYNDYLAPQGLETGFGVTVEREGGVNFLFSVLCADPDPAEAAAAVEQIQLLVPHLRRAFRHYRRDLVAPTAAWVTSAAPSAGIVLIGRDGRVLAADAAAQRLAQSCASLTIEAFGRFAARSPALMAHVGCILNAWDGRMHAPAPRVFHLDREPGALPLRVTAFRPATDAGQAYFRGPECILVLEDPLEGLASAIEEFGDLYGLTRAERSLVAELAAGSTADEISFRTGASRNTIKTHLQHVFAKSGLNRQADILRHVCFMAGAHRGAADSPDSFPAPGAQKVV